MAHTGEKRNTHRILIGKYEGKNELEEIVIDGSIISVWVLDGLGGFRLN